MIDLSAFQEAHEAFKSYLERESGGVPFVGFDHPFLLDDEIDYKWQAVGRAKAALQVKRWPGWRRDPAKIVDAVRTACSSSISRNLVEHRYGSPFVDLPADKEALRKRERSHARSVP